jgi:hypothetical protein
MTFKEQISTLSEELNLQSAILKRMLKRQRDLEATAGIAPARPVEARPHGLKVITGGRSAPSG